MTSVHLGRLSGRIALAVVVTLGACSDNGAGGSGSGSNGNQAAVIGVWEATSFQAFGRDLVAGGMSIQMTLTSTGYSLEIERDEAGICEGASNSCIETGSSSSAGNAFSFDPDTEDEREFTVTFSGNTMTWTGEIDEGDFATIVWTKATTGNQAAVTGVWNATSFQAFGEDFIVEGMVLQATITATGYSLLVDNDQAGICDGAASCIDTGTSASTGNTFTFDPGTEDEEVFTLSFSGNTMTWTGSIDGEPTTLIWIKV